MSRPPGRGSALTPDERREIQRLSIIDGCSIAEIARRTDRDRGTVSSVVNADDSEALRRQLETETRDHVRRLLLANAAPAAREWANAVTHAAQKGDHRPARDLLLHAGAIEPIPGESPGVRVSIIIGTPDRPMRVVSPLSEQATTGADITVELETERDGDV